MGVTDRDAVEAWREHLEANGVDHSGVEETPIGWHLDFKDPDGIALEIFAVRPQGGPSPGLTQRPYRAAYHRLVGRLRELLARATTPADELHDADIAAFCDGLHVTPIPDVEPRRWVRTAGEVREVRSLRMGGAPAYEVTVSDGRGHLAATFVGRRELGGFTNGRRVVLEGVVAAEDDTLHMLNPEYRLLPLR